jgi:hypothetical protein
MNKDSIPVEFDLMIDTLYNHLVFKFEKEGSQSYKIDLLPGAVTDFFDTQNDSLNYTYNTKSIEDFGNLELTISNVDEFPIIVELVDEKGKVESTVYETKNKTVNFRLIKPGSYYIRLIYDLNANGRWDTGDFLEGLKAEPVLYDPIPIEFRPYRDEVLTISLY